MINTEQQEMALLRQRLTDTEAELERAKAVIRAQAGAIIDVDLKTFHCMKQLLTANDVFKSNIGHDPMRVNILEILNDLRRFAKRRFEAAGIIATAQDTPSEEEPDASHSDGDGKNSVHRGHYSPV
jgi:hypothetical protein